MSESPGLIAGVSGGLTQTKAAPAQVSTGSVAGLLSWSYAPRLSAPEAAITVPSSEMLSARATLRTASMEASSSGLGSMSRRNGAALVVQAPEGLTKTKTAPISAVWAVVGSGGVPLEPLTTSWSALGAPAAMMPPSAEMATDAPRQASSTPSAGPLVAAALQERTAGPSVAVVSSSVQGLGVGSSPGLAPGVSAGLEKT